MRDSEPSGRVDAAADQPKQGRRFFLLIRRVVSSADLGVRDVPLSHPARRTDRSGILSLILMGLALPFAVDGLPNCQTNF